MTAYEETEVRRARRSWPVQYKLDILAEIDEAKMRGEPGAVGTICRREGLYSSLISRWRQQRDEGARKGLVERPTGPRAPSRLSLERDRYRQRAMLAEQQLETAEELIEAQGKALALLQRFARKSASPQPPGE